jgi:hypothetical protein
LDGQWIPQPSVQAKIMTATQRVVNNEEVISIINAIFAQMNRQYKNRNLTLNACHTVANSIDKFIREAQSEHARDNKTKIKNELRGSTRLIVNKDKILLGAFLGLAAGMMTSCFLLPYLTLALSIKCSIGIGITLGSGMLGYRMAPKKIAGIDTLVEAVERTIINPRRR